MHEERGGHVAEIADVVRAGEGLADRRENALAVLRDAGGEADAVMHGVSDILLHQLELPLQRLLQAARLGGDNVNARLIAGDNRLQIERRPERVHRLANASAAIEVLERVDEEVHMRAGNAFLHARANLVERKPLFNQLGRVKHVDAAARANALGVDDARLDLGMPHEHAFEKIAGARKT